MTDMIIGYRLDNRLRDLTPAEWEKILAPRRKWQCVMLSFAMFCALTGPGYATQAQAPTVVVERIQKASAITITLDQKRRFYRNTGTIVLRDPVDGHILGQYKFVSGGAGRGAAPFGSYEIGAYRDDPGTAFTHDSQAFRRRWMIRQIGLEDGEAYDHDEKRDLLELHSIHANGTTAGCLGIVGDAYVWDEFVRTMDYLRSVVGTLVFDIAGNPDGAEKEVMQNRRSFSAARTTKKRRGDTKTAPHHRKVGGHHKFAKNEHGKHRRRA